MNFSDKAIYSCIIYNAALPALCFDKHQTKGSQILRNKIDLDSPETQVKRTTRHLHNYREISHIIIFIIRSEKFKTITE